MVPVKRVREKEDKKRKGIFYFIVCTVAAIDWLFGSTLTFPVYGPAPVGTVGQAATFPF
jgi:hypothetical protein